MNIKQHIPNAITCGNLLCGCFAIVCAFQGNLVWSAYLVGIAAVLDFFDGFVARLLKVNSEIGKQLDSLADCVTFGVVPGFVMFHLLGNIVAGDVIVGFLAPDERTGIPYQLVFIAFLIPVFSALRLAKFNVDTRQSDSFIGVPTPANSMLICSLPLILKFNSADHYLTSLINNPYFLIALTVIMSYLLVAEIPLFALKFKNFSWKDNQIRFVFLIASVVLILLMHFVAIPLIIFLYIVFSIINNQFIKTKS